MSNPTSPPGRPQPDRALTFLGDMLAHVQGIPNQHYQFNYRTLMQYPVSGEPRPVAEPGQQERGEMDCPSEYQNEMTRTRPVSGEVYLRAVGTTPGTLDRMKRVVAKQKLCYGTPFLVLLISKNSKNLSFQSGWMQTSSK